eukprot:TRINITY_DN66835_c5_g1_i1.p1 TRINITY_DN66835_c5_g1~~TRINITY_DN66835_c5_g1_i1.p1  ORF type:complete len:959 (-),score=543.42 TRINITY_DN66835_c5_g1_i1:42-2918(-)
MLAVGLKQPETLHLQRPLSEFIQSRYGKKDAKNLAPHLDTIAKARATMAKAAAKGLPPIDGVQASQRYLADANMLASRFTFARHKPSGLFSSGSNQSVMAAFTWADSYRTNKTGVDYSIDFERASVLYNIGALYSLQGIRESRTDPAGIKAAFKYFQQAAGVFALLAKSPEFASSVTLDVSVANYRMVSHMLLAQAQACFFELAVKTNKSPTLISKLASGTSELFKLAYQASQKDPLADWLAKANYKWQNHYAFQRHCFAAASYFWFAKSLLAAQDYGREIGYLQAALDHVTQAKKFEDSLVGGLADGRSKLHELIQTRLREAVKDNDTVYVQPVPKLADIQPVEKKLVVKAVPFDMSSIQGSFDKDHNPFESLVPNEVRKKADEFKDQEVAVVTDLRHQVQEKTGFARATLASLGLPASLEALEVDASLPKNLWERISALQAKGGYVKLQEKLRGVKKLRDQATSMAGEIETILADEAKEDSAMRTRFGARWTSVKSEDITAKPRENLARIRSYLQTAANSDQQIENDVRSNRDQLLVLSQSRPELDASLPKGSSSKVPPSALKIRELLDKLSALLTQRDEAVEALAEAVESANITGALIANAGKKTIEQVFAVEQAKFHPMQQKVQAMIKEQDSILEQVQQHNAEFVKSRENDTALAEMEKVLQSLNNSCTLCERLFSNLTEGERFYQDLIKSHIQSLHAKVDDFAFARAQERKILLEQVSAASMGWSAPANNSSNNNNNNNNNPQQPYYQPSAPYPNQGQHQQQGGGGGAFNPAYNPYQQPQQQQHQQPQQSMYQPVQPQQPEAKSDEQPWSCKACTFQNNGIALACGACGTPRFPNNVSPANSGGGAPQQQQQPQQPQQQRFGGYPAAASGYPAARPAANFNQPQASPAVASNASQDSSSNAGDWSCPQCTLSNKATDAQCAICEFANPNAKAAPANAQQQEASKKKGFFSTFF